jgi:RNA polymerase sigma factor (sigma-70 family)
MPTNFVPEVRVEARVRNNVLWHAIFDNYKSVAEFCRKHPEVHQTNVGELLNLNGMSPRKPDGKYRKICVILSKIFRMHPDDLFPAKLYFLEDTKMVAEIPFSALPSADRETLVLTGDSTGDAAMDEEMRRKMAKALNGLRPREARVLQLRFGLNGEYEHTLDETGEDIKVSRERVRQIETKALRKLRHPSRGLKDFRPPARPKRR